MNQEVLLDQCCLHLAKWSMSFLMYIVKQHYHLRNMSKLQHMLSVSNAVKFMTSRLD